MIREFISDHTGIITNFDIDREFTLVTRSEKKARYNALHRAEKTGKISKITNRPGTWRILEYALEDVDFKKIDRVPISLSFPLGIGDLAQIYPGNIVLVSGTSNAGKTGFLIQTIVDTLRAKKKNQKESSCTLSITGERDVRKTQRAPYRSFQSGL